MMVKCTNACSLSNKWAELNDLSRSTDIIAISEMWLKETSVQPACYPNGYRSYRLDRGDGRVGGGILLLIADQYQQKQGCSLQTPNVQLVSSHITLNRRSLTVLCVYRSPSSSTAEDDELLRVLQVESNIAHNVLILGDFNAPEVS